MNSYNIPQAEELVLLLKAGSPEGVKNFFELSLNEQQEIIPYLISNLTIDLTELISTRNLSLWIKEDFSLAKKWVVNQPEYKSLRGKVILSKSTLVLEDKEKTEILSSLSPNLFGEELAKLIQVAKEVGDDREIEVVLTSSLEGYLVTPITKNENFSVASKFKGITISAVLLLTIFSSNAKADSTEDAIRTAAKAALIQTGTQDKIEQFQKMVEQKAQQAIKETGTEVPAGVIGFGAKALVRKKVELKGETPFVPLNYHLSVGSGGTEIKLEKDQFLSPNSQIWIQTNVNSNDSKFELGLKFGF